MAPTSPWEFLILLINTIWNPTGIWCIYQYGRELEGTYGYRKGIQMNYLEYPTVQYQVWTHVRGATTIVYPTPLPSVPTPSTSNIGTHECLEWVLRRYWYYQVYRVSSSVYIAFPGIYQYTPCTTPTPYYLLSILQGSGKAIHRNTIPLGGSHEADSQSYLQLPQYYQYSINTNTTPNTILTRLLEYQY